MMKIYEIPDMSKLPLWAKRVNAREGWQMISDIGHAVGVTWPDQDKEYNRWHSNTRKWWIKRGTFNTLMGIFVTSVNSLVKENDKTGLTYLAKYQNSHAFIADIYYALPSFRTVRQHDVLYMLKRKSKNMTAEEQRALIPMLHKSDRRKYEKYNEMD